MALFHIDMPTCPSRVTLDHSLDMDILNQNRFSGPVSVFQERRLPVIATPVGYAALIGAYGVRAPLPRILTATGERHRLVEKDNWRIYSPRHEPDASLEGHLTFALKYEGLDLTVLKRLFAATGPAPIETFVKAKPTGAYARRVWFLYEWLTGHRLDLPNADRGAYAPVVDPNRQFSAHPKSSRRHRVKTTCRVRPNSVRWCSAPRRWTALLRWSYRRARLMPLVQSRKTSWRVQWPSYF